MQLTQGLSHHQIKPPSPAALFGGKDPAARTPPGSKRKGRHLDRTVAIKPPYPEGMLRDPRRRRPAARRRVHTRRCPLQYNLSMTFPSLHIPEHLYFITASICGWRNIFYETSYANIVMDSLSWLRDNKCMRLFAYVLMPSHLHMVIKPENIEIGQLLQKFGSFTAHAILNQLRQDNRDADIQFFHDQRRDSRHQHSIWQDIQAQNIYSEDFLWQKMEYVHNNPVSKKWNLAADRGCYAYSSACYYDKGIAPGIEIDDVIVWLAE